MKVTVILPTFNRANTIKNAISSVLAQTHADLELIVVDDGSTDATTVVVNSVTDNRTRLVQLSSNQGAGAARNIGLTHSECGFVAFQDSDDWWNEDKLERQLQELSSLPKSVAMVYSDMVRISSGGGESILSAPRIESYSLLDVNAASYAVHNIGIQSCLIRRRCLQEVGGFDESLPALEDLELFIRLSRRYRIHKMAGTFVRYHESEGISSNIARVAEARRMLLEKYGAELKEHRSFVARELAAVGRGRRVPHSGGSRS